ncbi:hypothetical protein QBC38DRAFT_521425 [Podospora fimiseda]|uniref:Uncharacterized protein n=1 Tax=Podospora fimiseda TaxID=252190 RepID=A0AAN7BGJ8_9PEZI|nr:hypothetical protein QBC38DRAFT_521425 [Podospora fimiseda]
MLLELGADPYVKRESPFDLIPPSSEYGINLLEPEILQGRPLSECAMQMIACYDHWFDPAVANANRHLDFPRYSFLEWASYLDMQAKCLDSINTDRSYQAIDESRDDILRETPQFKPKTPDQKEHVAACGRFLLSPLLERRYDAVCFLLEFGVNPSEPDRKDGLPLLPKVFSVLASEASTLEEEEIIGDTYNLTEFGSTVACITKILWSGANPEMSSESFEDSKSFVDFLEEALKGPEGLLRYALANAFRIDSDSRQVECLLPGNLDAWLEGGWCDRFKPVQQWVDGWRNEIVDGTRVGDKVLPWLG